MSAAYREREAWLHIGAINLLALAIALLCWAFAGCAPCPAEVVAEVTVGADAGAQVEPVRYCADPCDTSADCAAGSHCSLHAAGQSGLCYRDFLPDGGRQ